MYFQRQQLLYPVILAPPKIWICFYLFVYRLWSPVVRGPIRAGDLKVNKVTEPSILYNFQLFILTKVCPKCWLVNGAVSIFVSIEATAAKGTDAVATTKIFAMNDAQLLLVTLNDASFFLRVRAPGRGGNDKVCEDTTKGTRLGDQLAHAVFGSPDANTGEAKGMFTVQESKARIVFQGNLFQTDAAFDGENV